MYEAHFGLRKNPFQSVTEGEPIFEGPAQTKVVRDLKTALTVRDSIAVLTGPVGVGKTTIVNRALAQTGNAQLVARLGRTQVGSDELVDLLLAQFGVVREPTRRFECLKTFNRILNERAASGARVFIVIEDAERFGTDLLEELEALTASDSGSSGANIVLMGPQKLDKLLTTPALERLRQRIRLQQALDRFSAAEVDAYLRHRIKMAEGDFDAIFDPATSVMVRRCSGGIPRVINSLCETALTVAAEKTMPRVTARIVFKVAVEVFGMSPGDAPSSKAAGEGRAPPSASRATPEPAPAKKAEPTSARTPEPTVARKAEPTSARTPEPTVTKKAEPAPTIREESAPAKASRVEPPQSAKLPKPPSTSSQRPAAERVPEPPAARPGPVSEKTADPAIMVANVPAAPATKSKAQATGTVRTAAAELTTTTLRPKSKAPTSQPSRARPESPTFPELPVLGDAAGAKDSAARKPMPELPPKFKFADEILLDRTNRPKSSPRTKPVDPPDLRTPEPDDDLPTISERVPARNKATAPPAGTIDDIPTLGDSARVQKLDPKLPGATPDLAKPEPASDAAEISLVDDDLPAAPEPRVDEPTASFAKIDHDMLDAALASLAVADDEVKPAPAKKLKDSADIAAPEIPEVTLDKNIEAERPARDIDNDRAILDQLAAELHSAKSLEDVSDKLAETLFGCEELEAISLKIRENAQKERAKLQNGADAGLTAEPAKAAPAAKSPAAATAPAVAKPAAAPQAAARIDKPVVPVTDTPAKTTAAPQPEPIENQFNTSMTASFRTLNAQGAPADDDDEEEPSGGLLGRLKGTFKS